MTHDCTETDEVCHFTLTPIANQTEMANVRMMNWWRGATTVNVTSRTPPNADLVMLQRQSPDLYDITLI